MREREKDDRETECRWKRDREKVREGVIETQREA